MTRKNSRIAYAILLGAALVGAAGEGGERLGEVVRWRNGTADYREERLYGPYRGLFSFSESQLPPSASVLLFSDWDPALIPYYFYPRKIFQVDVEPETNKVYMKLPPSPYPRRPPESFTVDWIIMLRSAAGIMVPEYWKADRP